MRTTYFTPIDAKSINYETLSIEIPYFDDMKDEWDYVSGIKGAIVRALCESTKVFDADNTLYNHGVEETLLTSKLVQIRTAFYAYSMVVIVRETPHDYEQYIHNLSGVHVNRIAKLLKTKLTEKGYQVS